MILETNYNEGDKVWVLNTRTGKLVQREIAGIRSQSINEERKTIYCFVKDWCLDKENPTLEDCFWLSEDKIFSTREKLVASFQ